jgi:hypothetical protein
LRRVPIHGRTNGGPDLGARRLISFAHSGERSLNLGLWVRNKKDA